MVSENHAPTSESHEPQGTHELQEPQEAEDLKDPGPQRGQRSRTATVSTEDTDATGPQRIHRIYRGRNRPMGTQDLLRLRDRKEIQAQKGPQASLGFRDFDFLGIRKYTQRPEVREGCIT